MLLDSFEEKNGILTIKKSVIISQSQIHHRSGNDLGTSYNGTVDDRMHSQNSTLRRIKNGSTHQRSESSTIGNSESTTLHILD